MHVEVVEEEGGRRMSYVVYSAANAWVFVRDSGSMT